jgi:single-strand DNA-binding protein
MNVIVIAGRVGNKMDLKPVGESNVINFSVAVKEFVKKEEQTTWHDVECWGKLAEFVNQYVNVGDTAIVHGKLKKQQYEKDGVKQYRVKIHAQKIDWVPKSSGDKPQSNGNVKSDITHDDIPF